MPEVVVRGDGAGVGQAAAEDEGGVQAEHVEGGVVGRGPVEGRAVGEDLGGLVFEACVCRGFFREGHLGVDRERAVDAFCVGC